VALALAIPLRPSPALKADTAHSPCHRLEHALHLPVAFIVIPIFGFANAGVSFSGMAASALLEPLTLGIALGLVAGKLIGVYGSAMLAVRLGWADMPANAARAHLLGVALLCGIGFTMSLFIGLLAFADSAELQDDVKVGILFGSLVSAVLGSLVLYFSPTPGGPESRR
jgi:Na+:H+ antiporter, NhaA family